MRKITKQEKEMREHARKIITQLTDQVCLEFGYKYKRIAIKNQRTRLGSCSEYGNLNFNWQIIKFPQNILEYVIKHEVAHLRHLNHSKNYWETLAEMDPDYKIHDKWINKNVQKYLKFR